MVLVASTGNRSNDQASKAAALLALFGKWFQYERLVFIAVGAFILSSVCAIAAAIVLVRKIDPD